MVTEALLAIAVRFCGAATVPLDELANELNELVDELVSVELEAGELVTGDGFELPPPDPPPQAAKVDTIKTTNNGCGNRFLLIAAVPNLASCKNTNKIGGFYPRP